MRDSSNIPQFSRYTIEGTLGSGGMGTVYLAYHEILNRPVALKVPKRELSSSDHFVQRFLREAKALGTLHHRNIVTVYDAGIENDTPYIAMKYIAGKTLSELIRESGQIEIDKVIRWGRQIADALAYLHDQQILHRDLKGANIIIDQSGDAVVADFGIAQIEADSNLTRGVLGTPSFMSPEQAMGKDLDARSDMYGLGVLLYQSLTGDLPFRDDNSYALIQKVIHETPKPVSQLRPETPIWLENIVHTCLKKHPGQRFKDDRALLAAFDNALTRPVVASKALTFLPARRRLPLMTSQSSPKQSSVRILDLIQSRPKPLSASFDGEHTITLSGPDKHNPSFLSKIVQHGIFLSCAALVALVLVAPLTFSNLTGQSSSKEASTKSNSIPASALSGNDVTLTKQDELIQKTGPTTTPLQTHPEAPIPSIVPPSQTNQGPDSLYRSQQTSLFSALPITKLPEAPVIETEIQENTSALDSITLIPGYAENTLSIDASIPGVVADLIRISTRRELIRSLELSRKGNQIRYGNRRRVQEPDLAYIFLMNSSNEGLHAVLIPSQSGWTDVYTGRDYFEEKGTFYTRQKDQEEKTVIEDIEPIWVEVVEEEVTPESEPAKLKRRVTGW